MGGLSGEREVSKITGKACSNALKKKRFFNYTIGCQGKFCRKVKKIKAQNSF